MSDDILVSLRQDSNSPLGDDVVASLALHFGLQHTHLLEDEQDIRRVLGFTRVLVVVIDRNWLTPYRPSSAVPRSAITDSLHIALAEAFRKHKLIVPVLIDGARMPGQTELPPDIAFFSRHHGLSVQDEDFLTDMEQVIDQIDTQIGGRSANPSVLWGTALSLVWALVAFIFSGFAGLGPSRGIVIIILSPIAFMLLYTGKSVIAERRWLWIASLLFPFSVLVIGTAYFVRDHPSGTSGVGLTALTVTLQLAVCSLFLAIYGIGSNQVFSVPIRTKPAGRLPEGLPQSPTARPYKPPTGMVQHGQLVAEAIVSPLRERDRISSFSPSLARSPISAMYFLSYRRADSGDICDRMFTYLDSHTSEAEGHAVFRDVQTILAGADFVDVLDRAINGCEILLAIIGENWITVKDASGQRRIASENDYVRLEIATALRLGKVVVPVLVSGATLPSADELPPDLAPLSTLAAFRVSDGDGFSADMSRLVQFSREHRGVNRYPIASLFFYTSSLALSFFCVFALFHIDTLSYFVNVRLLRHPCTASTCTGQVDTTAVKVMLASLASVAALLAAGWLLSLGYSIHDRLWAHVIWLNVPMAAAVAGTWYFVYSVFSSVGQSKTLIEGAFLLMAVGVACEMLTINVYASGKGMLRLESRSQVTDTSSVPSFSQWLYDATKFLN